MWEGYSYYVGQGRSKVSRIKTASGKGDVNLNKKSG